MDSIGHPGGANATCCPVCGTVSVKLGSFTEPSYSDTYYHRWYERFAVRRRTYLDALLATLGHGRAEFLVDVGCGSGQAMETASALGWRPIGFEASEPGARLAASRAPVARAAAAMLPIRGGTAGAALLLDVVAHVDDPAAAVRAAVGALRPGGVLMVKTPRRPRWAYAVASRLPAPVARALLHLPHQRHAISPRGLAALLTRNGLDDVSVQRVGEPIPRRCRFTDGPLSWLSALVMTAWELAYGRPSIVATGRVPLAMGDHGQRPSGAP